MKHPVWRKYVFPLITACLVLLFVSSPILKTADRWVQDYLYQRPGVPSGDIKIIEIDEKSLSEIGPYGPSYRAYMARALQVLAADPDNLPAVVAIDILYEGESDPAVDTSLPRPLPLFPVLSPPVWPNLGIRSPGKTAVPSILKPQSSTS